MRPLRSPARPATAFASSASPATRAAGAAGLLALLVACGGEEPRRPPASALLVTLDTTRADALSCYGGRRGLTPHLDRLAAEGVRYARAQSVAPLTLPSHASMLTGLYPLRHGVRDNGLVPLPGAASTLAELAGEAGIQTGAFIASIVLDEYFGLAQGFDVYVGPELPDGTHQTSHFNELPGAEVVERAIEWYRGRDRSRRFFLWVHLFDPHGPYEPPPRFSSRAPHDPYLGEVAAADDAVGRLLDAMREDGGLDETCVLLVADHGEAHGEHNESTHGSYCYQTTMHVPLLLRYPGGEGGGRVSEELASVVDVHPTLAEALGLRPADVPGGLDGRSLYGRTLPADRGVYFESYNGYINYGWSPLAGWLDARGKYLHSSEPQLFDLARDPQERVDLAAERAHELERYQRALAELAALPRLAAGDAEAVDEALLQGIRDLGYAAAGVAGDVLPDPLDPTDRPSPASREAEQLECMRALHLFDTGRHAEALPVFQAIVAENPRNYFALDRLTNCLMSVGRAEEAIEPLRLLLREGPQWPASYYNLGLCLDLAGRPGEALEAYRRATELQPNQEVFLRRYVRSLKEAGRTEEHAEARARLQALRAAAEGAPPRSP